MSIRAEANDNDLFLQSIGQFERINGLASEIYKQNIIHAELVGSGVITIKPFQDLADDYLRAEQRQTFDTIVSAAEAAPYEEIGRKHLELEAALGRVAAKLAAIEVRQTAEAEKIHKEQEMVAGRLPNLAPRLSKLAEQLEQRLIDKQKSLLEAERVAIETEQTALAPVYEAASQAWPIPRLIETKVPSSEDEPEIVIVDNFPEQGHKPTKEQVAEKVRHKYPDDVLQGASEFISLLLAEEPKYIYTQEELAEITYGSKDSKYRTRVSALISNFELGKVHVIGQILQENGLVFQRGERTSHHKDTGKRFGIAKPVYRAVPISETDCRERVVQSYTDVDWVHDGWHNIVFNSTEPIITDEVSTGVKEAIQTLADNNLEHAEPTQFEPLHNPDEPCIIPEVTPAPQPKKPEIRQKREAEWVVNFRADLQETIARFKADGLMLEGELSWQVVNIKSSSRSMCTEKMAERAVSNGIIKKSESTLDSTLPVTKYICMALQNKYRDLFSNPASRKKVENIVKETVSKYFEETKKKPSK